MLTLAILLAAFVAYVQFKRPIASLEWLVMPVVVVLLLMAGHFGKNQPQAYLPTTYSLAHRLFTYLGALAFVVAGATGALYLMSDHMLRARPAGHAHLPPSPGHVRLAGTPGAPGLLGRDTGLCHVHAGHRHRRRLDRA